jgi:hypothetical protein
MRRRLAAMLGLLLLPAAAWAQGAAGGDVDLEARIRRQRAVVRPPTDASQVARDAEAAVAPPPAAVPGPVAAPGRRPDLGYDVLQGIQQRHVLDAIRRR